MTIPTVTKNIEVGGEDDKEEQSDEDLEHMKHACKLLLDILDKSIIDDHNDWLQVGMILFKISNGHHPGHHDFLDL